MVSFVDGFKLPTENEKIRALGRDYAETKKMNEFSNVEKFWADVPVPTHIDDWLAQYEEHPQSYREWESLYHRNFKNRKQAKTIYLLQLGSPGSQIPHFNDLIEYIKLSYGGIDVQILPCIEILCQNKKNPLQLIATYQNGSDEEILEWDIDARTAHEYDLHRERKCERQIRVDPILNILSYILPSDALCLCGITMEDLYDGNEDSFVSGMAAGGSHIGIFSFARYTVDSLKDITAIECEGLQMSPKTVRSTRGKRAAQLKNTILLRRSCKTLSHEIGHMFAIGHCVYYNCIMNGSGHLLEDFAQSMHFCPIDLRKLKTILRSACIWERYQRLLDFYVRHKWHGDASWVSKRVEKSKIEKLRERSGEQPLIIEID